MTNTTLLINEQEKENAKALTQSFTRSDVKSRAFINALGAEVCLQYLQDNDISSEGIYNIHSIRKILEEFDISDVMLSNIHIDVRVVYNDNEIFIPKSHFDYKFTPDIYVVMQVSKDYSQMEFLGFFEPKMLNKHNTNGDYYFIEKEKLSSPVDFKSYVENFAGSASKDLSDEDIENAEFLIVSMADNNVSEADKKQLLNYLKNSADLRNRFIEFENFEMLAYHAINIIDDAESAEPEINEIPLDEMLSEEMDLDMAQDIELSNALNSEPLTDSPFGIDEISEDEEQSDDGNMLGNIAAGAAVLGAEIAGSAMASAALAGAAESAEIAKDTAGAAGMAIDAVSDAAEAVTDGVANIAENFFENDNVTESDNHDELFANSEEIFEQNIDELGEPDADIQNAAGDLNPLDMLFDDDIETNIENTTDENSAGEDASDALIANVDSELPEEPQFEDLFEDIQIEESPKENFVDEAIDNSFESGSDEIEFTNNDNISYEDSEYDVYGSEISVSSDTNDSSANHAFSPVMHTPISEATDLVSLESIQHGELPPIEPHHDQLETMEMDEFQNLVDNYVPTPVLDESETVEYGSIGEDVAQIGKQADDITSDDFIEAMPQETNSDIKMDDVTSDDFVQEMPDEVSPEAPRDELSSDDFVQDMPEELSPEAHHDELSSDDFVQDMPEELPFEASHNEAVSDEIVGDNLIDDNEVNENAIKDSEEITSLNEAAADENEFIPITDDIFDIEPIQLAADISDENIDLSSNAEDLVLDGLNDIDSIDTADIPDLENIAVEEKTQDVNDSLNSVEDNIKSDIESEIPDLIPDNKNVSDNNQEIAENDDKSEFGVETDMSNVFADLDDIDSLNPVSELAEDANVSDNVSGLAENIASSIEDNVEVPDIESIEAGAVAAVSDDISSAEETLSNIESLESVPESLGDIDELSQSGDEVQDAAQDDSQLGFLYNGDNPQEINAASFEDLPETYDFRPKSNGTKWMPICFIVASIIIAASVVGFLIKSKNIDDETLIQSSAEGSLTTPETDNTGILSNENDVQPAIPSDLEDISPSAPAPVVTSDNNKEIQKDVKQEVVKNAKEAIKQQRDQHIAPAAKTPLNASKTVSLKKLSWEVPDYLSYSDSIKKYLQSAGKSIKLTLSSDLLLTNEYIYTNRVKVNIKLSKNGDIQDIKVAASSGSNQVDKIVLQTVKDTLNVVKPPQGEVPTPNYNLGLIIYL